MEDKKNSKKILALIIVVVLVVAGGVYAYVSQRQKTDKIIDIPIEENTEDDIDDIDDIYGDDFEGAEESEEEVQLEEQAENIEPSSFKTIDGPINFKIDQLSVNGHYNGVYPVNYKITRIDNGFSVAFYSEALSGAYADKAIVTYSRISKNGQIDVDGTKVNVEEYYKKNGLKEVLVDNPTGLSGVKKIGEQYFVFSVPQVISGDQDKKPTKDAEIQQNITKGLQNHFNTLVEI